MEPLKRQQRKVDNEYTIMFIPHRGKEPKSFSFRASLLKKNRHFLRHPAFGRHWHCSKIFYGCLPGTPGTERTYSLPQR